MPRCHQPAVSGANMHASSRMLVTLSAALALTGAAQAQLLISGNDEKQTWNDEGKPVLSAPGKDTLSVIDIRDRTHPRVVASLPLMNTVVGPPTNLAITPDGKLALLANSLATVPADGGGWK